VEPAAPAIQPEALQKTVEVPSTTAAPAEPENKPSGPAEVAYTVQPGDTLNKIARRFGVGVKDIIARNRIENPDRVDAGKVLDIPQGGEAAGNAQAPAPEVQAFVEEFFARSGAENPDSLVELYAEEGDFYKKGMVPKNFVLEDKVRYFQRWPRREYTVSGKPQATAVPGTKRTRIEVPVRYKAKNAEKTASGEAVFVFVVSFESGSPRIVSEDSGAAAKK
jgi:LysM repeat protein